MKQFKMTFPLMALVLGLVGAFAFSPVPPSANMTESWFVILDPEGNHNDPDNYEIYSGTPACNQSTTLCAVYALVDQESDPEDLKPDAQDIANIGNNPRRYQP